MAKYTEDRCSVCKAITAAELLTIKMVTFAPKVTRRRAFRSRVVAWLCEGCREKDVDFNAPAYGGPGHTSPALERVREDRVVE